MTPFEYVNVTKQYGSFTALNSLTLQGCSGECLVFLGPNGAGKSTAIRLLLGLISPTSGTITIFDREPSSNASRARVGYLPGEMGWPLGVKCGEWLTFLAELSGRPDPSYRLELLDQLNFPQDRLTSYTGTLSQGMKRKLGLVATLEHRPDLIILDEPSDGLDPIQQRSLLNLLKLRSNNTTLLLSTHDLREAYELADRIAVFNNGELAGILKRSDYSSTTEIEEIFFEMVAMK